MLTSFLRRRWWEEIGHAVATWTLPCGLPVGPVAKAIEDAREAILAANSTCPSGSVRRNARSVVLSGTVGGHTPNLKMRLDRRLQHNNVLL